ncbi:MAG TPA: Calx-beta domain-containing protein [Pyrinomonadaceae bacterium]|nr:Calx-beta domain-containing protein [Pyrinomonadaceae bacterium]
MPLRPRRPLVHYSGPALFAAILFTALLLVPSRPAYAAGGDLDPSFGSGGKVAYHFSQMNLIGSDITTGKHVVVQPDGKIVIGLHITTSGSTIHGVLVRLNPDGMLDTAFGDGGKVLIEFGFGVEALALQPDGKILAGGEIDGLPTIKRFNSDGSPDSAFGTGGKAQIGFFYGSMHDIAVQSDGKIVGVGRQGTGTFMLARFSSNGTPDATFGTGGLVSQTPFTGSTTFEEGHAVVIQPDGKILVGCQFTSSGTNSSRVLRFNTNGSADATFTQPNLNALDVPDLALQSDGKILAALIKPGGTFSFAVARLNTDGTPDVTFDGDGIASTSFVFRTGATVNGNAYAVRVQPDGKILAVGNAGSDLSLGGETDFALARFNSNGSLDTTFGNNGRVLTDFGNRADTAYDFAFQPDGKIVAVGTDTRDLVVARYFATETPLTLVQFSASTYTVAEACTAKTITVTRSGVTTGTTTVEYSVTEGPITSSNNTASSRTNFTIAAGTLTFNPGEISKDFNVLISDNGYFQGSVNVTLLLGQTTGGGLGQRSTAVLTITDDETAHLNTNPIDDAHTFVCQHYHDFLNRQPDATGETFWTNQIIACGTDQQCIAARRNDVSTAFFLSIEFQQTGYFVIRLNKVGLGDTPSNPRLLPFLRDTQEVGRDVVVNVGNWEQQLESNRQRYAVAFVSRPEFVATHAGQSREQFVDSLFANAGVTPAAGERDAALAAYGTGDQTGRANALRSVAESKSVYNKLYNEAFVLMQYFGYLRRNPDASPDRDFSGYQFWLSKLDSFSQPGEDVRDEGVALRRVRSAEMVKAFITSGEYRSRFGFN